MKDTLHSHVSAFLCCSAEISLRESGAEQNNLCSGADQVLRLCQQRAVCALLPENGTRQVAVQRPTRCPQVSVPGAFYKKNGQSKQLQMTEQGLQKRTFLFIRGLHDRMRPHSKRHKMSFRVPSGNVEKSVSDERLHVVKSHNAPS